MCAVCSNGSLTVGCCKTRKTSSLEQINVFHKEMTSVQINNWLVYKISFDRGNDRDHNPLRKISSPAEPCQGRRARGACSQHAAGKRPAVHPTRVSPFHIVPISD